MVAERSAEGNHLLMSTGSAPACQTTSSDFCVRSSPSQYSPGNILSRYKSEYKENSLRAAAGVGQNSEGGTANTPVILTHSHGTVLPHSLTLLQAPPRLSLTRVQALKSAAVQREACAEVWHVRWPERGPPAPPPPQQLIPRRANQSASPTAHESYRKTAERAYPPDNTRPL